MSQKTHSSWQMRCSTKICYKVTNSVQNKCNMLSNEKVGISTLHLWWKHQLLPSFHILISPTSTCHLINQKIVQYRQYSFLYKPQADLHDFFIWLEANLSVSCQLRPQTYHQMRKLTVQHHHQYTRASHCQDWFVTAWKCSINNDAMAIATELLPTMTSKNNSFLSDLSQHRFLKTVL